MGDKQLYAVSEAYLERTALLDEGSSDDYLRKKSRRADCCCFVCPSICCLTTRHVMITLAILASATAIVLASLGVGVYFGTEVYIASVARGSDIALGKLSIEGINGSDSDLWMTAETYITDDTFTSADFEDIRVTMYRADSDVPFGKLISDNADVHIIPHKDNFVSLGGKLHILDQDEFTQFNIDLYKAGNGTDALMVRMDMLCTVKVMGLLTYKNIAVSKVVPLNGLANLTGPVVTSVDIFLHHKHPDSIWIDFETCFENPSNVTIKNIGYATLTSFLDGVPLSVATTKASGNMESGKFCQGASGPSNWNSQESIARFFNNYFNDIPTVMTGSAPSFNESTTVPAFRGFLYNNPQTITVLPYGKELVDYSLMDLPTKDEDIEALIMQLLTPPYNSVTVTGTIIITAPFTADMELIPHFNLVSHGMIIGETLPLKILVPGNAVHHRVPVNISLGVHLDDFDEMLQAVKVLTEVISDHHSVIESQGGFHYLVGADGPHSIGGYVAYNQTLSACDTDHEYVCISMLSK